MTSDDTLYQSLSYHPGILVDPTTVHAEPDAIRIERAGKTISIPYDRLTGVRLYELPAPQIISRQFDLVTDERTTYLGCSIQRARPDSGQVQDYDAVRLALLQAIAQARPDMAVTLAAGRGTMLAYFLLGLFGFAMFLAIPIAALAAGRGGRMGWFVGAVMFGAALISLLIAIANRPWQPKPPALPIHELLETLKNPDAPPATPQD
ncbi:MAG: hypothetical protein AAGI37_08405 [Planctomycetota bacterium]